MPATSKTSAGGKEKDRRRSTGKNSTIVTLRVQPSGLRKILDPSSVKEESPAKSSPAPSASAPSATMATGSNGENASPSSPGTPAPNGTPSQPAMGPPTEAPKKKGTKRGAAAANGGDPTAKIRGKPGPKKKPRLEDGSIDPSGRTNGAAGHKLGPKYHQGAINAGLRALDIRGPPCRKWNKGGFRVKSFTGVVWEVPRWTAPPKPKPEASMEEASAAVDSSNKENNEGSQEKSERANSAIDGEQPSMPPSVTASSPVPMPMATAS